MRLKENKEEKRVKRGGEIGKKEERVAKEEKDYKEKIVEEKESVE